MEQKAHRFHLDAAKPRRKMTCPACGRRKCFTPYVDELGEMEFPEEVGICDHKNSCGWHYSPKDYFRDHPEAKSRPWNALDLRPLRRLIPSPPRPTLMDRAVMLATLRDYDDNRFFCFIAGRFGWAKAVEACLLYNVGTSRHWPGSTVFWLVDERDQVHAGKIMLYRADGHRAKTADGRGLVTWAHTAMHITDFVIGDCLFGQHLLSNDSDKPVIIVESEKTAVIGSIVRPQYLWLACGGLSHLKPLPCLRDRKVILQPDLGGYEAWSSKSTEFERQGCSVSVSDILEQVATDAQRAAGLDIADYILAELERHSQPSLLGSKTDRI